MKCRRRGGGRGVGRRGRGRERAGGRAADRWPTTTRPPRTALTTPTHPHTHPHTHTYACRDTTMHGLAQKRPAVCDKGAGRPRQSWQPQPSRPDPGLTPRALPARRPPVLRPVPPAPSAPAAAGAVCTAAAAAGSDWGPAAPRGRLAAAERRRGGREGALRARAKQV